MPHQAQCGVCNMGHFAACGDAAHTAEKPVAAGPAGTIQSAGELLFLLHASKFKTCMNTPQAASVRLGSEVGLQVLLS
jgi:hypothetical protein